LNNTSPRLHAIPILAIILFCTSPTTAQLVATKDLTEKHQTAATSPQPRRNNSLGTPTDPADRECVTQISDGVIVREIPERLLLAIVSAEPGLVIDGASLVVTIRLTNAGKDPVLVPWETKQVEPDNDPETGTTRSEWANIHLTLATLDDRRQKSYLKGDADLFAAPSNRSQHIELLPGQWAEAKLRAIISCNSKETWACRPFKSDENAEVIAHWWESLTTHKNDGCDVYTGYYKSRTLESLPIRVAYVATSPPKSNESVAKPKSE
jgi:hypothetical protein